LDFDVFVRALATWIVQLKPPDHESKVDVERASMY
jgi:methylaspartate ammonia-lyase